MNAVELEEAVSALAEQAFDPDEFPYAFLEAFGNTQITIKRLRSGVSNKSDLGGVLQVNHIHFAIAPIGAATQTLAALRDSQATKRAKAKFVVSTDGHAFEAEDLSTCETIACDFKDFPDWSAPTELVHQPRIVLSRFRRIRNGWKARQTRRRGVEASAS